MSLQKETTGVVHLAAARWQAASVQGVWPSGPRTWKCPAHTSGAAPPWCCHTGTIGLGTAYAVTLPLTVTVHPASAATSRPDPLAAGKVACQWNSSLSME